MTTVVNGQKLDVGTAWYTYTVDGKFEVSRDPLPTTYASITTTHFGTIYTTSNTIFPDGHSASTETYMPGVKSISNTTIEYGGFVVINSGSTASGTTVNSGGIEHVQSGGMASGTIVNSGGDNHVWGETYGTTVNGGVEIVEAGGMVSGTTLNSGEELVRSDGTARETTVNRDSLLLVMDGGQVGNAAIYGGTVEFLGSVSSDSIVIFGSDIAGILQLDDAAHFSGIITGFSGGNTIDLGNVAPVTSVTWKNNNLSVLGAGGTINITLVGNYQDAQFEFRGDTGHTKITLGNLPTGSVTITGTAIKGQTLTATNNIADADGLGIISYQWKSDGTYIDGATASTLVLADDQVGEIITVVASYTDSHNNFESVTSSATAAVTNINHLPTGSVTISGTTTKGQSLAAANTLVDVDGLGVINYQWKAGGTVITGATASTLVLTDAQVGKTITVVVSYTDGKNTLESVTSGTTAAVTGINSSPTVTRTNNIKSYPEHTLGEFRNSTDVALIKDDGSVDALGYGDNSVVKTQLNGTIDVSQIFSTSAAFAALRTDGSVVTWGGDILYSDRTVASGGNNSAVATQLNGTIDVSQIFSTYAAFAALRTDGSVVTWGDKNYGGDSSAVAAQLNGAIDVSQIYSTEYAFAALHTDGSVVTWGDKNYGGDSGVVSAQLNGAIDVSQIFSTSMAFAALRTDGSVVTWGDTSYGGNSSAVAAQLNGAINASQIFSTSAAFAALRTDGSVVTWGEVGSGGDSSAVAAQLNGDIDVSQIYSTSYAFAALRTDGSVVTWGYSTSGGDSSAVAAQLNGDINVSQIYSTGHAFAALRTDGSVVTWGGSTEGGNSGAVATQLNGDIDVSQIYSTQSAFAALRTDGSVVTWGYSSTADDISSVATQLNGDIDVSQIYSSGLFFTALRTDGTVVTWGGGETFGLTSASGVVSGADIYTNDVFTAANSGIVINNTNSLPTGSVTITGSAAKGQTLAAANTLADLDGLGVISYQWKAGGVAITDATTNTLVLADAQVGKTISVVASYTDGKNILESVASNATAAVTITDTTVPTITTFSPEEDFSSTEDTTGPTITAFSPEENFDSTEVSDNIVLTFDEVIQQGIGKIVLKTLAGKTVQSFNIATSHAISISDDTLTIDPAKKLTYDTTYQLVINSGVITDTIGNAYAGLHDYYFTTTDTLTSSASSYTLGTKDPKKLTYSGTDDFMGTGNKFDNEITGGDGNDTLNGGLGNDTLTGGDGDDQFVFNTKTGQANIDTITDFTEGSDQIVLSHQIFKKLSSMVEEYQLVIDTEPLDKNDYLIYDSTSGTLFYDADGSGKGKAVEIAVIGSSLDLTADDFIIN
jgi:autotransporter passenger strand-loop-strand repeat protein